MKRLLTKFSLLILMIVLLSCKKNNDRGVSNFPTAVGNKWIYYNDFLKNYIVKEIIGNFNINNINCFALKQSTYSDSLLLHQIDGSSVSFCSLQNNGLFLIADSLPKLAFVISEKKYDMLVVYKNSNILVKYPLDIGNAWTTYAHVISVSNNLIDYNYLESGTDKEIVDKKDIIIQGKLYHCYVIQSSNTTALLKEYWTNDGLIKIEDRLIFKNDTIFANVILINRISK